MKQIQAFAATEPVPPGILETKGETTRLVITSARASIAWRTSEVHDEGGTYRPTPAARLDVVSIKCGSTELGQLFDCSRIVVRSASGSVVRPIGYRAGPEVVQNAMGAKWAAHTVLGTYPLSPLRNGFAVAYSDTTGAEWSFVVTEDAARETLLLQMPQRPPLTQAERARIQEAAEERAQLQRDTQRAFKEKQNAEWAAKAREEEAEDMKRRAALQVAQAEQARVAATEACRVAAVSDRGDLRGCLPAVEVCASIARQGRLLNGCPQTPLSFEAGTLLPRATKTARLIFACRGGQLAVALLPGLRLAAGPTHQVRITWGDAGEPEPAAWIAGATHDVITAPDATAMADQMAKYYRLAIEVTPDGGVPVTAEFNIGADPDRTDVKYLRALCGTTP